MNSNVLPRFAYLALMHMQPRPWYQSVHMTWPVKDTCDLPKDAKITYGMPVHENERYFVGLLKYKDSLHVLLIDQDKMASKCPNSNVINSGRILASLPVNIQPSDESQFITLECETAGTRHHLVGVVKQKQFKTKFVRPERSWEIDLIKHQFNEVDVKRVQCFVGSYD